MVWHGFSLSSRILRTHPVLSLSTRRPTSQTDRDANGAGKSTFVALTLAPLLPRSVFVNADEIAKQRWPDDPLTQAYDAARVASETRCRLIELGRSFIAEMTFSHPSKLDHVHAARAADCGS
ncbi:MAG: Zeta toxin [Mycobacterium sp.]|nr:Zeta toxin [Mycobacterium sp.]